MKYLEWTVLSQIDVAKHIKDHFKSVDDWAVNFTMIKQKRVDLKRLDDREKKDCITVSLLRFKGAIEDSFKQLSD